MFEKVMNLIQSRTRDDWVLFVKDKWVSLRIWAQENGEFAFLLGVCLGFCILVLHKLFFLLLAVGFILGFIVYHLAPVDLEELSSFSEDLEEEVNLPGEGSSNSHSSSLAQSGSSEIDSAVDPKWSDSSL